MSFAALESRLVSTSLAKLANVEATIGGVAYPVVFSNDYAEALGGLVSGGRPSIRCSATVAAPRGTSVMVRDVAYQVAECHTLGPDQLLVLEET